MTWAALLLAVAVVVGGDTQCVKIRAGLREPKRPGRSPTRQGDPLAAASTYDVLAACLQSGMAVPTAARATAPSAPPHLAGILRRAADLLALGAEPSTAWSNPPSRRAGPTANRDSRTDALLRLVRRSASSGAALAQALTELAAQSRSDAADSARATAERASVLIAAPLGLCYLPAFLCLGIVPVVAGLAGDVLNSGLL